MNLVLKKDEARREICFKNLPAVGPEVGALVNSSELDAGALVPSSELDAGAIVGAAVGPVLIVENLVDCI